MWGCGVTWGGGGRVGAVGPLGLLWGHRGCYGAMGAAMGPLGFLWGHWGSCGAMGGPLGLL